MNSVEIIVGQRWQEDVRHIHSLRRRRPAESSLNLLELRDIIDIVIDGTNLTASIPEEAIFGLVGSLLDSLVELIDEERHKSIVEFHHEPWELVLVPDGKSLLLSLYSIDRRRRVVARDLPIDARSFVDALCEVAEEMLTGLFRVSEHFSSAPQVRRISQSMARLKKTRTIQFAPRSRPPAPTEAASRLASTSTSGGLTFEYRFDATDTALRSYGGTDVFDLHALLFDGSLRAEFGADSVVLTRRYPFLAITSLLDRTRQLFNQLEGHANAPFVIDEELALVEFTVEGRGTRWLLRAGDVDDGQLRTWKVHPAECLDVLVSVAELFVQDLSRVNACLEVNQRYLDLQKETEKLRHWHRDLCGNNLYHDRPEDYLRRLGHLEPHRTSVPASPEFSWPLSSVHTLFPRRRWHLRAGRIDFSSLTLTPDSVLMSTSEAIRRLDQKSGDETWARDIETSDGRPAAMSVAGERIVVADDTPRLQILDTDNGESSSTVSTDEPWRHLLDAVSYTSGDLMVAGCRGGTVIGFDPTSGTVHWRHSTGPGTLQRLTFDGPLVCTHSSEGVVVALNPKSGETLWKIRTGGTPEVPVTMHQGRLYTVSHDSLHRGSTLHALYPFTGRSVWQLRLSGVAAGMPSFVGQWMLLPVERHGQIVLSAIDLEAVDPRTNWELELSSAGVAEPTPVLPVDIDGTPHGLIRTDRAELTCFSISDGAVRWRSMPADETLLVYGNLPLFQLQSAVVNVSQTVDLRELDTGRLLQSFSAVEVPEFCFLAPPFRLLFGERTPGDEDTDQLTAYSVEHFLAVVGDE